MVNLAKWGTPALSTVMSTELNSLANCTGAASVGMAISSSAYDNSTNRYILADVELFLASFSPPASALVSVFALPAVDAATYPTPTGSADLSNWGPALLVNFAIGQAAATAQRIVARQVPIPPSLFKVGLINATGVAFASSGNTVKFLAYGQQFNG